MRNRTPLLRIACLGVSLAFCDPVLAQREQEAKVFDPAELCDRQYASGLEFKKHERLIDARNAFIAVTEACPEHLNAYLQLGNIALHLKEYDDAIRHFGSALELDSTNVEIRDALAYAVRAIERTEEAQARPPGQLANDPDPADSLQTIAFNLAQQGGTDEAIMLYSRAIEADSTLAPVLEKRLAQLYLNQKEYTQALHYFQKLRGRNPDDLGVLGTVAYLRYTLKDYEAAVPLYQELLRRDGQSPRALDYHKLTAFSLGKLERFEDAVEHYELILQAEPDEMIHYYQYGNNLVEIGRLDRAEELARAGLAKNPSWGCLHYILGKVAEKRATTAEGAKNWDGARNLYKQAQDHFRSAVGDAQCGDPAAKQIDRQAQLIERLDQLQEQAQTTGRLESENE